MQDRIRQIDETSCNARPDHTLGSKAPILECGAHVRFASMSGGKADISISTKRAMNGLMHRWWGLRPSSLAN
jgi:hypothetical protein